MVSRKDAVPDIDRLRKVEGDSTTLHVSVVVDELNVFNDGRPLEDVDRPAGFVPAIIRTVLVELVALELYISQHVRFLGDRMLFRDRYVPHNQVTRQAVDASRKGRACSTAWLRLALDDGGLALQQRTAEAWESSCGRSQAIERKRGSAGSCRSQVPQ